ncbi:MAG: hypothetical protein KF729_18950 [Sandaracinaceae bacterium]|nr:hypothetical protein [Sandaracinaceae bacterium]
MSGLGRAAALLWLVVASAGCVSGGGRRDAGPGDGVDAGGGTGMDAGGPTSCSTNAECDDATPCTLDECVVGNVCQHTPLHSSCPSGQMCVPSRGCVEPSGDCASDADCDDGRRCNGEETCVVARGMCLPGTPIDCNDNNECTLDRCSETGGMCQYELLCDGGPGFDAGPGCEPFDAATHYAGDWRVLPSVACDPGLGGGYSIGMARFSVAAGTLTITMGSFTLTQTPAPTGDAFDASGSNGCATVRLAGTMECATRFSATWTANHAGSCAACRTTTTMVAGRM